MRLYGETDVGLKRVDNQDSYKNVIINSDTVWSIVCDGMGGVNGGEVASKTAVEAAEVVLNKSLYEKLSEKKTKDLIVSALMSSNSAVFNKSVTNTDFSGMGTTAVLAVIKNGTLYISHIGDSRAYLYSNHAVTQVTEDHSLVQNLVKSGYLSKEEARMHPQKNIITNSIGVHDVITPDCKVMDFNKDSLLILCTDGLSDYVSEESLLEYIENLPEEILCQELIKFAKRCGGQDNITITVISNR